MRPAKPGSVCSALLIMSVAAPAEAQQREMTVDDARAHLALMARPGGYWVASNAAYATAQSGEPGEYLMDFSLSGEGYTMRGCMWAETAEGPSRPFWRFFSGWDPSAGAILQYQVNPGGVVAVGWQRPWPDGGTESIQTLSGPGRAVEYSRHLDRSIHPDTLSSRSFAGSEEAWTPRRSYTWIWRTSSKAAPCT